MSFVLGVVLPTDVTPPLTKLCRHALNPHLLGGAEIPGRFDQSDTGIVQVAREVMVKSANHTSQVAKHDDRLSGLREAQRAFVPR